MIITPAPQEDRSPGNHCSQVQPLILVLAHQTPLLRQEPVMEPVRGREAVGWGGRSRESVAGWHRGRLARNSTFPPTHTPVLRPLWASAGYGIHPRLACRLPRGLSP